MSRKEKREIATGAVAVLFATREGQTAKIAGRVAEDLRARGFTVEIYDLRQMDVSIRGAAAVVLAASVHLQRHEKEMASFVRAHRQELARLPTLFLSVSLSEAGAEDRARAADVRAKAAADVDGMAERFFEATGFRPTRYAPVAGKLAYPDYNWLIKLIMKRIAAAEGASTDTSRAHEYTDWDALDATADRFASELIPDARR